MILTAILAATVALADRPTAVAPASDQASYKAWLADQAMEAESNFSLKERCPEAVVRDISSQVVSARGAGPGLRSHGLAEAVLVEGCGRRMRVNLTVLAPLQGQAWQAQTGLPGESLAGMGLQQQAASQLGAVVGGRRLAGCEGLSIGEAQVIARPGGVRLLTAGTPAPKSAPGVLYATLADPAQQAQIAPDQAWAERWPLSACGRDASVTVLFGPYKDGTNIMIHVTPAWADLATPPVPR